MLSFNGELMGKPASTQLARERWLAMAGHEGVLMTGHCVIDVGDRQAGECGRAHGRAVRHADSGRTRGVSQYRRAGAGGRGVHPRRIRRPFIDGIDGDHGNVIGLSLPLFRNLLDDIDVEITDLWRLKIGPIAVDPPVVLAPMAGVTNAPFRQICRSYGAALYVSEMVSARALIERNPTTDAMVRFGADEPVRSLQLYGVDPGVMHAAVRYAVDELGVDHLDLNFGCPAQKVNRVGGGAALPLHHVLFGRIVAAAVNGRRDDPGHRQDAQGHRRRHVDLPHRRAQRRRCRSSGDRAACTNGRTAVLGRGRLVRDCCPARSGLACDPGARQRRHLGGRDAVAMMRETGCDGVVVGRGCLGKPWLFRELTQAFAGQPVGSAPSLGDVVEVMRRHLALLVSYKRTPQLGVRAFRKHVGWYLTGFAVGPALRRALMDADTAAELDALFDSLEPGPAAPGRGA